MQADDSDSDLQQRNQVTGPGQAARTLTLSRDTDQAGPGLTIRPFNPRAETEVVSYLSA